MQHQPVTAKVLGRAAVLAQIAVLAVANNGVAQMCKVTAKLVLAPGFGQKLHQTISRGRKFAGRHRQFCGRHTTIVGHRWLRAFIFAGKFIGDFIQFLHQGIIKRGGIHQPATHDGVVAFLDLVPFKLLRQQAPGLTGKPHQQNTRGWPIETMGSKNVLTDLIAHGLHDHHFLIAIEPATVHQPAGRFIHRH